MKRYRTDAHGMISSFDIADALRRAERRRLEDARRRKEREKRIAERRQFWFGWLQRARRSAAG